MDKHCIVWWKFAVQFICFLRIYTQMKEWKFQNLYLFTKYFHFHWNVVMWDIALWSKVFEFSIELKGPGQPTIMECKNSSRHSTIQNIFWLPFSILFTRFHDKYSSCFPLPLIKFVLIIFSRYHIAANQQWENKRE